MLCPSGELVGSIGCFQRHHSDAWRKRVFPTIWCPRSAATTCINTNVILSPIFSSTYQAETYKNWCEAEAILRRFSFGARSFNTQFEMGPVQDSKNQHTEHAERLSDRCDSGTTSHTAGHGKTTVFMTFFSVYIALASWMYNFDLGKCGDI